MTNERLGRGGSFPMWIMILFSLDLAPPRPSRPLGGREPRAPVPSPTPRSPQSQGEAVV